MNRLRLPWYAAAWTPAQCGAVQLVNILGPFAYALVLLSSVVCLGQSTALPSAREQLILVIGAGGTDEYAREFSLWGEAWQTLAEHQQWPLTVIDGSRLEPATSRSQLQAALSELTDADRGATDKADAPSRLWIVLVGHGTAVGETAKFNLVGPDVSAKELSAWIEPLSCPLIIVNASSASAPFLPELSGPQRMVITATRSASELNYSRFGKYLAQSLEDLSIDIDHDLEVSLLEAFLAAVDRTEQFYRDDARLTTEHAMLDDNGDRRGTSADFFRGVRPVKTAKEGEVVDGALAARVILYSSPEAPQLSPEQIRQRQHIEQQLDALRGQKPQFKEAVYYQRLEQLLLDLAEVYEAAEPSTAP
ncbi:MAG: hypothetical protein KDA72_00885 [Planctomycetales bacterium]|nr:hypothetical protein [Planctomycetales bacterium]